MAIWGEIIQPMALPIRMAVIKRQIITSIDKMWRNQNPHTLLVAFYNSTATLKNSLPPPQRVKHRVTK